MTFFRCYVISILLTTSILFAEGKEPINTDRPDQGDGTYTLEANTFQFEEGIVVGENTVINNLLLRYGIADCTELRLGVDAGNIGGSSGIFPLTISAKQRIIEQDGVIPAITLVGYLAYEKLASSKFQGDGFPAEVKLAFQNEINSHFTLGYNIGTSTWLENLITTFGVGYSLVEDISIFVEYFSTFDKDDAPAHNLDFGGAYLLNNNLQVDIAAGHSLFDSGNRLFVTAGISVRLD
jgi:hypothetical protein